MFSVHAISLLYTLRSADVILTRASVRLQDPQTADDIEHVVRLIRLMIRRIEHASTYWEGLDEARGETPPEAHLG